MKSPIMGQFSMSGAPKPREDYSGDLTPASALERLAENLHFSMERFDPSSATLEDWGDLAPPEKLFYFACVRELLRDNRAITVALLGSETFPTAT
jgi:hypothetical protein